MTRQIAISEEAYERLSRLKEGKKSFTKVILELTEIKVVFDRLAERADKSRALSVELQDMPFGTYGQFTDKYGVPWKFKADKKK